MNCYKVVGKDDCQFSIRWVIVLASSKEIAEKEAIMRFGYGYFPHLHKDHVKNIIREVIVLGEDVVDGSVLEIGHE